MQALFKPVLIGVITTVISLIIVKKFFPNLAP